jgi:hypothetical protein
LPNNEPQRLRLLARLVVSSLLALIVAGIVWHGISIPIFQRIWHDLVARTDARMRFRFILQPLMAAIVAIRDGLNDARIGNVPYFWRSRASTCRSIPMCSARSGTFNLR